MSAAFTFTSSDAPDGDEDFVFVTSSEESETELVPGDLALLKDHLAKHFCDPDNLRRPDGIATGLESLDSFLFWRGLPKGALSLFSGALGSGATSLWIEAAARSTASGRWAAWIDRGVKLSPLSLHHRGMDLGRLVTVEQPESDKKLFWLLQELMSSSLFELIGCDLGEARLKEHQLRKLQAQARQANVALVFLSQGKVPSGSIASVFSLLIGFEKRRLVIQRALHRPTPHCLARSLSYARFTLHTENRFIARPELRPEVGTELKTGTTKRNSKRKAALNGGRRTLESA